MCKCIIKLEIEKFNNVIRYGVALMGEERLVLSGIIQKKFFLIFLHKCDEAYTHYGKNCVFFNIEKVVFFLVYFPENRKSLFKKLWKLLRNANQVYTTVKKSILEGSRNVHPQKKEDFQWKEK